MTSDQAYPTGGDGHEPNRELRDSDLSPHLDGSAGEIYFKFEDAAPDQVDDAGAAAAFGPRLHQLGLFTEPVVRTKLGERLWPNLVRTDGNSPTGGLILIKKQYGLDAERTLTALTLPSNIPRGDPILSIFAITLANDETVVSDFMLY